MQLLAHIAALERYSIRWWSGTWRLEIKQQPELIMKCKAAKITQFDHSNYQLKGGMVYLFITQRMKHFKLHHEWSYAGALISLTQHVFLSFIHSEKVNSAPSRNLLGSTKTWDTSDTGQQRPLDGSACWPAHHPKKVCAKAPGCQIKRTDMSCKSPKNLETENTRRSMHAKATWF